MNRVNIEQAIKLKELGFNYLADTGYTQFRRLEHYREKLDLNYKDVVGISAPYIAEALEWIRNEKGIPCSVEHNCIIAEEIVIRWFGSYSDYVNDFNTQYSECFDTYEESESALLDELIRILEEK